MKLLSYIVFILFLSFTLFCIDSFSGTGAIPNGDRIKLLKDKLRFKNQNIQFISNDTDSPMVVAKDAEAGSLYIQTPTGRYYRKVDGGSSINWQLLIVGATGTGSGTDNHLIRWDGTGSDQIQDSLAILNDLGELTGLTRLDVDNLRLDGNTISSLDPSGDIIIDPTGTGSVSILSDLFVGGSITRLTETAAFLTNAFLIVNEGGTQAFADANKAGLHVGMVDAITATMSYNSAFNSRFQIGDFGLEEEVLTANHVQSFTSKTGSFVDGSVGLPSIYFDVDNDSGFWHGADNDLRISTGGAERLAIRDTEIVATVPMTVTGLYDTSLTPDQFVRTGPDGGLISTPTVNLVVDVDGILPRANGGTNSDTPLSNEKIMVSQSGKIDEWSPLGAGEYLTENSGGSLQSQSITGTANQVIVAVTDGNTNFSLPQDINIGASPSFSGLTVTGLINHIGLMSHVGNYDMTGDLVQNGDQFQTGNVIRTGNTDLIGNISMSGSYDHIGSWSHSGSLDQFGPVFVIGSTDVIGDWSLTGGFVHIGDVSKTGLTEISGEFIQYGNSTRTGTTDLIGDLSATGNIYISGDISSIGFFTHTGGIYQIGTITHTGDLHVIGDVYADIPVNVTPTGIAFGTSSGVLDTKESVLAFNSDLDTLTLIGELSHTGGLDSAGLMTHTGSFAQIGTLSLTGYMSATGKLSGNRIGLELLSSEPATPVGEMVVFAMDGDNNSIFSKHPDGTVTDYSIAATPTSAFCVVYHDEAQGVAGDNLVDDTWDPRTLNATNGDCSFLSLASDQATITQTGTYRARWHIPILNAGIGKSRLEDVSASGSVLAQGSNVNSAANNESTYGATEFTVTGAFSRILELQTYVNAGSGTGQGGSALNLGGSRERYQTLIIEKVTE